MEIRSLTNTVTVVLYAVLAISFFVVIRAALSAH